MYLSLTLDRAEGKPVFVFSPAGGMSIEDVAKEDPSKIHKVWVDPFNGPCVDELVKAAEKLGIP
jgi:succinyl-CoA synthetase beta subunit